MRPAAQGRARWAARSRALLGVGALLWAPAAWPGPVAAGAPGHPAEEVAAAAAAEVAAVEGDDALLKAAQVELERARTMHLPGQPPPYLVIFRLTDAWNATAGASFGARTFDDTSPYRHARIDVRVGDYALDNSNFASSGGSMEGVALVNLPADPSVVALRRELWLAADRAYKGAVEELSARQAALEGRPAPSVPSLYRPPPGLPSSGPVAGPPLTVGAARARVEALSAPLRGRGFEEGDALSRDYAGRRLLLSSEGLSQWSTVTGSVAVVEAVTRTEDGVRLRDLRWWVAPEAGALPPLPEMVAEVERMAERLEAVRSAPVEPDYLGPVIFEHAAAVELFRQLLQPELVGTPPMELEPDPYGPPPENPPTARIGRRLLPDGWSIVDDPLDDPRLGGAYAIDGEGIPAERVELVEDGLLKTVLMSRVPRKGIEASNGHGRALGSDRFEAMPSVVTVRPDRERSDRRLQRQALRLARQAGLNYVLVVQRVEPVGLTEDFEVALSGDAPLSGLTRPLEVVRRYADGREELVRGLSFSGVDRRALRDVAMAGALGPPVDVLDAAGGPARYSLGSLDGLRVTWRVPSVLITELELRSSAGPEPRAVPPPAP